MRLWSYYWKGVIRKPGYWLLWLLTLTGLSVLSPLRLEKATGNTLASVLFLLLAYIICWLIHPRRTLRVDEFTLHLPGTRERLAWLGWLVAAPPLMSLVWLLYGFSRLWLLHGAALLLLSLLMNGSLCSSLFLLVPLSALFVADPLRLVTIFLFALPFLIALGQTVGKGSVKIALHVRGFRYTLQYFLPFSIVLIGFDLYQALLHSRMRFVMTNEMIGFHEPDFERPLFLLIFFMTAIISLLLPVLNLIGLRESEARLVNLRQLRGTPVRRRLLAFGLGLAVNLPVGILLYHLRFVEITPAAIANLLIAGALVNTIFRTDSDSDWVSYAVVVYFVLAHSVALAANPWIFLILSAVLASILYDIDICRSLTPKKGV
jgi:hypothetical protein